METNYIKVVLVGDSGVGKTQLLNSYCFGLNPSQYPEQTVGCDYVLKRVLINGQFVKLQIWDISGAEATSPLMKLYLKTALGVIFVYDVTSNQSKQSLLKWKEIVGQYVDEYNGKHVPFIVVGNKLDLMTGQQEIQQSQQELNQFCNAHEFQDGILISSYTHQGMKEAFEMLVEEILRRNLVEHQMKRTASRINKLQIQDMNVNMKNRSNCQ